MATTDAVLVIDATDPAALTADRLPRTPGQLPCGSCGELADHHWKSYRAGRCRTFTRPALPDGYAYADTLARDTHIRRRSRPAHGSELVLSVTPASDLRVGRMLVLTCQTATGPRPVLAYLSPDMIVEVLPADAPLGA